MHLTHDGETGSIIPYVMFFVWVIFSLILLIQIMPEKGKSPFWIPWFRRKS